MKNFKKNLCTLFAITTLASFLSVGCVKSADNSLSYKAVELQEILENPKKYENQPISVQGAPYSVNDGGSGLAIFIGKNNKGILCFLKIGSYERRAKVETLVEAEINDGDTESITIKGVYDKNELIINSVEANGYTINLER